MKIKIKYLLAVGFGAASGFIIYKATKTKQLIAKEEGTHVPRGPYEAIFKRPLDVLLSSIALVVLSPVMLITALLVRLKLGTPVLFTQERPGMIDPATGKEKIFKLYKFRTMTDEKDENGDLLPDEERLTELGKWLRSTSLDELPELFNIIKGDMSIIGPRPLLVKYLPYYSDGERLRHTIRPGLTGYAQINGRNEISWEMKFESDNWYVDHVSFLTDIKVIIDTVRVVLSHDGISLNALEDFDEYRKHSGGSNANN